MKIFKNGNSAAIYIPITHLAKVGLAVGDEIIITSTSKSVTIRKKV